MPSYKRKGKHFMTKLEILNDIINNHSAQKITVSVAGKNRKVLIDSFTARIVLTVYSALNEAGKAKLMSWNWLSIVNFCHSKVA